MDINGFLRVAAAVPDVTIGNPAANAQHISLLLQELENEGAELVVLPEMCITGYTCADLFHSSTLLNESEKAIAVLAEQTCGSEVTCVVGAPVKVDGALYNCAIYIHDGRILAVIPKSYIPNYNEFYEQRWWRSGAGIANRTITLAEQEVTFGTGQLVEVGGVKTCAEICEDLWVPAPPSVKAALAGAELIVNLSASDALTGKYDYIRNLVTGQSARCLASYVYASAGYGESSTDLVFDGIGLIASNGRLCDELDRWSMQSRYIIADIDIEAIRRDRLHQTSFADCANANAAEPYPVTASAGSDDIERRDLRCKINPMPFVPAEGPDLDRRCREIVNIQATGLARRLQFTRCHSLVVGISGGLDSTLALLVAVEAFDRLNLDRSGITGVTMPGFGTTGRTHDNAVALMETLGVTIKEISIVPAVLQHFNDINHDPDVHDVTYENAQARQRTYLLMDIANQTGGMVLGTGDLSELALGWATYNGDHMSMYGVNAGVPKTLVRHLVRWFAGRDDAPSDILYDIADTPISPELIPAKADGTIEQKTEDLVGPYELHDFFLYYTLRYGFTPSRIFILAYHAFKGKYPDSVIFKWEDVFFRRFFSQQFKRSCLPDGPKVGSVCLSPRGDWRMPSDITSQAWLDDLDKLRLCKSSFWRN